MMKKKFLVAIIGFISLCFIYSAKIAAQTHELDIYKFDEKIQYPYQFKYNGNPLVPHISSTDPDVHVWDDEVWMYCSQDHEKKLGAKGSYDGMDGYHAFSSKDLINWTDHGEVMHSRDISWGKDGYMWAPGASKKNGKYYLYYPHRDKEDKWRIGVAIGDTPAGPFKDIGKPIEGIGGIDPKIFIDDDGEAYIYNNQAIVAKLKPNMIELDEAPRKIVYASPEVMANDTLRFNEGSYMHKKDGKYYYSFTNFHNKKHQGFYAVGGSPYGPFEWKGAFVPKPSEAQNHHSIIEFKGQWYIFYHINTPSVVKKEVEWNGARRIACYDPLYYNADGSIKMVEHSLNFGKETAQKPNIVWLVSEDNCPYIGAYGDTIARTPNIDKLAETGVVYNNAFSNAPVCAPSRNTIITGMYANSLGNQQMRSQYKAPDFVKLFPYYLKEAGYYTSNCKKEDYNISMETHPWSGPWDESSSKATYKNRKSGQPFFHVKNFGITHESQLFDSIPDEKLFFKPDNMVVFPYHPNTPDFRHDYAQYYHRISQLDTQIGEVLDDLKKQGLYENTIVFYYSDHGGVLPRGKRYLFESGLRVPLIVHVPKMYEHLMPDAIGSHSDRMVSFVDLAPSILNLAGIKIPKYMQGQPFLGENLPESKDYAFGFRGRMDERYDLMHSARNQKYRYIRNYYPERIYGQFIEYLWQSRAIRDWEKLDKVHKLDDMQDAYWKTKPYEELYDIVNDPHNINNLANKTEYAHVLAEMSKATNEWIGETRPLDVFPEPMMVDIDKKGILYDSINGSKYPLMKIHEVARMSARASKKDFKTLYANTKDKNPVIAFWGIKSMFQYENEIKSENLIDDIKKNLSHQELYIKNLTANLLISLGEEIDCKQLIINGINSNNRFNRLEGLLLYERLDRNEDIDLAIKKRYEIVDSNLYEQSVIDKIMGVREISNKVKKNEE